MVCLRAGDLAGLANARNEAMTLFDQGQLSLGRIVWKTRASILVEPACRAGSRR